MCGGDVTAPVDILRAARGVLSDPGRWTRYALARACDETTCNVTSAGARCFCAMGAVFRAGGYNLVGDAPAVVVDALALLRAPNGLARFNDDPKTKHADVLALFDAAIARAGAT